MWLLIAFVTTVHCPSGAADRLAASVSEQYTRARVLSLNLAGEKDPYRIAREIRAGTGIPDILLLQEVRKKPGAGESVAEELAAVLGLHAVFGAPKPGPTNIGVAILSRWPLRDQALRKVRRFYRVVKIRPRLAIAATADTPFGPVRIWNTHLDTRINVDERLEQLRPLLAEAAAYKGPCIFGGDFNTVGLRWFLHAVPFPGPAPAPAINAFMKQHGFRTPFRTGRATFDSWNLQLDWVFVRGLSTGATGIEPLDFSDHHAVWTEITID
jgi:endonuclease/exonuclease/phosphatase family metal-dependent hydrolase